MNYSIMIPTFNEEIHLDRILKQINFHRYKCFILDSSSSDDTLKIAKKYGIKVIDGKWNDFSQKLNFGIDLNPFDTEWIIRLDADEYFDGDFISFLNQGNIKSTCDAIYVKRKLYFMGQWIKYGGTYPNYIVRIFRPKKIKYEHKILDEHIDSENFLHLPINIIDNPLTDLKSWTFKHVRYAETYCIGYFSPSYDFSIKNLNGLNKVKTYLQNIYLRAPLFIRPFLYFFYRYFIRLGFLDGKKGLIFHFMHAFWYRFLIDALIYQEENYKSKYKNQKHSI